MTTDCCMAGELRWWCPGAVVRRLLYDPKLHSFQFGAKQIYNVTLKIETIGDLSINVEA